MRPFTSLSSWKAPDKPSVKEKVVLLIGAVPFKLGRMGKRFCQVLIEAIYGSHAERCVTRMEIAAGPLLNYALGWSDDYYH